jgi:hypothetical protein
MEPKIHSYGAFSVLLLIKQSKTISGCLFNASPKIIMQESFIHPVEISYGTYFKYNE